MSPMIEKISKLLNLAERASTPEEAEAFFQKAQVIATRNAIDIEEARQFNSGESASVLTTKTFDLGKTRTFGLHTHVTLFCSIADANDVQVAVRSDSTKIYAYGYDTDIAVVETLFTSLVLQMTAESEKYLARGDYKKERIWREGYWENYGGSRGREWVEAGYKPVHGSTARISFKESFARRVGDRLYEARRSALQDVQSTGTGAELVLVSKAAAVENFYKSTSNAKGSYKGGQGMTYSSSASAAGREAANRANLGSGVIGKKGELQ